MVMVGEEITGPLNQLGEWMISVTAQAIPLAITSFLLILVGWIVASIIGRVIQKALVGLKLDSWMEEKKISRALFNISMEHLLGSLAKWYVFLLFLQEAAARINLQAISTFFGSILQLIPQWFIGGLTVATALVIGNWLRDKVESSGAVFASWIGNLVYGFIAYIGIVLALPKFGFTNVDILIDAFRIFIGGISVGIALAIGIGFGWAIKEGPAKDFFKRFEKP